MTLPDAIQTQFIGVFKDTCALVREAELADAPYLLELVKAADKILGDGVGYSYGKNYHPGDFDKLVYDFMPSWAHDDAGGRPLIQDKNGGDFPLHFGSFKTEPWNASSKRHPKSTNLSRFRFNLPALTPTPNKPLAASVLDARCEISSSQSADPIRFLTSPGNACLALTSMSGYKNRSPALEYIITNQPLARSANFPTLHLFEPGLARVAFHGAIDESRRLIFIGDEDRIKSYEWGRPSGKVHEELLPVHTLNTRLSSGPMTVLPNGSVVRAGKGGASVFDLKVLPTHGPYGDKTIGKLIKDLDTIHKTIGKLIKDLDTIREDPDEIEPSTGSAPTSRIKFLDQPNLKPSLWQPLLTTPSTVVCVESARDKGKYSCIGIDLEAGKSTSYYLGHGADVSEFSVSPTDPQLFLTACNDGFARLFDVRRPLPVVTFDACGQNDFCQAAALAHPDNIPIVFTGTHKREQIKVWDVRARACVYELATGNNAVQSLAWDSQNNCLYAATECAYMDRLGYHHDYRYAKVPKDQNPGATEGGMEDDEDDEDDEDGYEDGERCWPKTAWHKEDYFGYLFDAGDHLILRYAFKEDPKLSVVPKYGDASVRGGYW
ncbi:hypothetical protein RSAG8_02987, partial [Rhizoctonia solani AG-8 WAC10335]